MRISATPRQTVRRLTSLLRRKGRPTSASLSPRLFLLLVFVHLCAGANEAHAFKRLVLACGEWPPYFSSSLPHGGFGTRVSAAALTLSGINATFDFLPWKRAYLMTKQNRFDGSIGWRAEPDKERSFLFSEPILTEKIYLYYRKSSAPHEETPAMLQDKTVGVTIGYAVPDAMQTQIEDHNGRIEGAPSDLANLRKLLDGRIDFFPCSESVVNSLARDHLTWEEKNELGHTATPFHVDHHYFVVAKTVPGAKELIARFNASLNVLKQSGLYGHFKDESIHRRYLPLKQ